MGLLPAGFGLVASTSTSATNLCLANNSNCLVRFEMRGHRKILRVSWTAKKTNEWVLNKAGVKRELLDTVKARKLA